MTTKWNNSNIKQTTKSKLQVVEVPNNVKERKVKPSHAETFDIITFASLNKVSSNRIQIFESLTMHFKS